MAKAGRKKASKKTREVTLDEPISAHGEELTKLVIHMPKAKDFEAMDAAKGPVGKANRLLASCARIPYSSVLQLEAPDYDKCMSALDGLGDFLPSSGESDGSSEESLETGPSSSD